MASGEVVRIICPNLKCRTILSVPGSARGKSVRCRSCGTRVSVPNVKSMQPKAVKPEDAAETPDAAPTQK